MPVTKRTRFEVFKRDNFTCRYCGKSSPQVILEVDHIIAIANGGGDDEMNLATSCWDCNRGKSDVPLIEIMTGEDPHDKAILIAEQERQLAEYNVILAAQRKRQHSDLQVLIDYWNQLTGYTRINRRDLSYLKHCSRTYPVQVVLNFMDVAESRDALTLYYLAGCLKNWTAERTTPEEEVAS